MKIEQIYTGCLAHGAYYIESRGEAVIIDPLRDYTPYVNKAEMTGAKIKYILETHFQANFVSGHLDLARATGAPIVFSPTAQPEFEAHIARDGEELKVDGAINVPLDLLKDEMDALSSNEKMYLHCAGGYRPMIASSILKARGFDHLIKVDGGFD